MEEGAEKGVLVTLCEGVIFTPQCVLLLLLWKAKPFDQITWHRSNLRIAASFVVVVVIIIIVVV